MLLQFLEATSLKSFVSKRSALQFTLYGIKLSPRSSTTIYSCFISDWLSISCHVMQHLQSSTRCL